MRIHLIALCVALAGVAPGLVAASEAKHPSLYFDRSEIPALQARTRDPVIGAMFERVKARAIDYDTHPARQVLCAGIAWHLTGERRYADEGVAQVMRSLRRGPWFKGGAAVYHCDLNTAKKVLPVAFGYDLLHGAFSEDQRAEIRRVIGDKVFRPYLEAHAHHDEAGGHFTDSSGRFTYWTQCYFNWNQWINGDVGLMGLALYHEMPEAKRVVEAARASLRYTHAEFDQGASESGGWDEGAMYWGTALGHAIQFYAALERVVGTDDGFFDLPGVRMTARFPLDFTGPDGHWVPFSDCNHRRPTDPGGALFLLAKRFRDPALATYPEVSIDGHHPQPFGVLWRPPGPPLQLPAPEPVRWYRDIHWARLSGPRATIAFKGGDLTANHGQPDANSLVYYLGDVMLVSDPGYGERDTGRHSTLLVGGGGQEKDNRRDGRKGNRAGGRYSNSVAVIERCDELVGGGAYLVSEGASCYPALERFRRHVVLDPSGIAIVFDEVVAHAPERLELRWQSAGSASADGTSGRISAGEAQAVILADSDRPTGLSASGAAVRIDTAEAVPSLRAVSAIVPGSSAPDLEVDYGSSEVVISLGSRSFTFTGTPQGYRFDAEARPPKRESRSRQARGADAVGDDRPRERPVRAAPTKLDDEARAAWVERMGAALEARLAAGEEPYVALMGQEFRIAAIEGGTLDLRLPGRDMRFPFARLPAASQLSLALGLLEVGGDEERLIAAVFLRDAGEQAESDRVATQLAAAARSELAAAFGGD